MKRSPLKRKTRLRKVSKKRSDTRALDQLCRDLVLARDGPRCRKCHAESKPGRGGALQSCHILPKGSYPALRWELDNLITMCWSCHLGPRGWHKNPIEAAKWIEAEIGAEKLERLRVVGLSRTRTDKKALRIYLMTALAALPDTRPMI